MKQRELIDFLNVIEKLKCNTRHSWTSTGRHESVAEHSWRLAVMALLLEEEFPGVDISKVLRMCLIHDFGEALTGDIPAFLKTSRDEENEEAAIAELLSFLPSAAEKDFTTLFDEMAKLETPEAKLYKALDKMETIISHNESSIASWLPLEYEQNLTYGASNVAHSEYLKELKEEINRDSIRKIEENLRKGESGYG
ncbi:MAG: HD domain-containing protein [Saccharofermentanales bacterium]